MNRSSSQPGAAGEEHPTLRQALRLWFKIGLLSFGGPTGQIALMHQEIVERRRWVSDARFLHALNYCMLLPGPEAQQLSIYIGWLLHRTLGGILAGLLFVLPGAIVMLGVSFVYVTFGDVPLIAALFYGLKPAVMAIVAAAVLRIGRRALKNEVMWTISALAFAGIFFFGAPFPAIIVGAGILGLIGARFLPQKFNLAIAHGPGGKTGWTAVSDAHQLEHTRSGATRTAVVTLFCLAAWFAPVIFFGAWLGVDHTIFREGLFFSKAAVVTFGGAYAVLPYVAQQAVENYGWITTPQMMDGLGLAETTPGPLVLVLQFVGFLGAWSQPDELSPLLAGILGAFIASWVTFTPGFLFIFAGAPYIERLRGNVRLTAALSAITAAVVGVILNLAVWFGLNVLFPEPWQIDWFAVAVSAMAFVGLVRFQWDVVPVILGSGLAGVVYKMLF